MEWQRWHAYAAALATLAVLGFLALRNCGGPSSLSADAGAEAPFAAPAPDDLLSDVFVPAPNASWTKLQRGVGGAAGILPSTLPGVVVAWMDLDPQIAAEVDGAAPMYGAASGDLADPSFVFAMRLVDPRRARLLLTGDAGRYVAKEVRDGGAAIAMTLLVPSGPFSGPVPPVEMAISHNGYLLIMGKGSEATLGRLAGYVTRTLPQRSPSGGAAAVIEIPRTALRRAIKPKAESLWKDGKAFLLGQDDRARAERGRPPDFGDPTAIVAALDAVLARRIAILGDLERVRVVVEVTDEATSVTATLTPDREKGEGGAARRWVESMRTGDAAAVGMLPATSLFALSTRDGESERAEQAKELERAIVSSFGPRLKDPAKLHEAINAGTRARDETVSLALDWGDPSGCLLHAPVRDVDAAEKAIRGAVDLARADPFKDLLRVGDVSFGAEELTGLGKVSIATLSLRARGRRTGGDAGPPKEKGTSSIGIASVVEHEGGASVLSLGAGAEPTVTLKRGAWADRKLADEPAIKRFTLPLGNDAATILIAQPLRIDPKRASLPTSPVGIAIGKKGSDAFIRLDIADGLLREAARWQMGF